MRTLFGALRLPSPRWRHCPCRPQPIRTFSPLAAALPDRSTPELVYLQAKFGGLISYGLSARLLGELLPLGRTLHATTVRRHTYRVGQRLDDDLGPERPFFVEGCPADWEELPRPDLFRTDGADDVRDLPLYLNPQAEHLLDWFHVTMRLTVLTQLTKGEECLTL